MKIRERDERMKFLKGIMKTIGSFPKTWFHFQNRSVLFLEAQQIVVWESSKETSLLGFGQTVRVTHACLRESFR